MSVPNFSRIHRCDHSQRIQRSVLGP